MDPTEPLRSPSSPPIDPRVGVVLGDRYRIVERIGTGGMGAVYRGEHITLRRRVAIKVLHSEMSNIPEVVERFEREARAAAVLEHPNVVAVTDFGRTPDGLFYLVMEYIEGPSLRDALDTGGAFTPARAANLARQIGSALACAHAAGIVHRDLKPENVMVTRREDGSEVIKVVDFGIAKVPKSHRGQVDRAKTMAGMVYGTPDYMPPEQALGEEVSTPADVYALGVVLFEAVTGSRPYEANDVVTILAKQVNAPVPVASKRRPGAFPAAVDDVLARMMAKQPTARYATVHEAVDAFLVALDAPPERGVSSVPSMAAVTKPDVRRWAAIGGGALLLLLVGVLLGRRSPSAATTTPASDGGNVAVRPRADAGPPRVEVHERLRRYLALPQTQEGMERARQGEYEGVVRAFEQVWDEGHDGVVAYVLGTLASQKRKHDQVMRWFDTTLRAEPGLADSPELIQAVVRAYTEGRPEPGSEALLAGPLEHGAVRPLTEIALAERASEARTRAERLLRTAAFQPGLDAEARAILDLRSGTECATRRAALESLRTIGTARALPTLGAVRVTRCNVRDDRCNQCLADVLEPVKVAVRARVSGVAAAR